MWCRARRGAEDVGRLIEEHFKRPDATTLLRYVYAYDAAGNRTSKETDYDDNDASFAATSTYTNNGYNQLETVEGTRGNRVNATGTIPTAWTLSDGDVTVTPNEGDSVPAQIRGRFFVARNVPLIAGDNTLVASTSNTTLAGHSPSSDTVEDVTLDTSISETYTYRTPGTHAFLGTKRSERERSPASSMPPDHQACDI